LKVKKVFGCIEKRQAFWYKEYVVSKNHCLARGLLMNDNSGSVKASSLLLRTVVIISGVFSLLLGTLVLIGWYTGITSFIQVLPSFVPMQYNTALGFLLCGSALLFITQERRTLAQVCGGIAAVIGVLTLGQYIFGFDLGIDQLLMKHYVLVETSHPGRMAPNTALCFFLTGTGVLVIGKRTHFRWRPLLIGILGSVIVALGAVAFFGYLSSVKAAYGWGNLTRMAVHTALGFLALGTGIFMSGWREGIEEDEGPPRWLAIPAGIGVTAIALFQWQAMKAQEQGSYEFLSPADKSPLPSVILAAGLLMAVLLTITINLARKLWDRARAVERFNRELQEEIAERLRIEEELRKSEGKYRLLADNTLDCIWHMDLDFRFTYINPSVLPMFGYTPGEWIGSFLKDRCSLEDLPLMEEKIRLELDQPGVQHGMTFEACFLHKEGRRVPVEVNGKLLLDDSGTPLGIQGTLRDITLRKKAEEDKEELEELLRQAHKMEAVGTLAGGIAHDFNNILGMLIGYTELSLDELPKDSSIRQNLNHVLNSAERAKEMVKQILAFSRKSEVQHVPVYLDLIVEESLKLLRPSIPSTVEIHSYINSRRQPILADSTQIHQVIMNLCTNAAHAMRENGGILEVTLKTVKADAGGKEIKEVKPGDYQELTVSDTGHGMDEVTMKRIFDPYFTTKKVGEGTGMGLAMVHGIVKDHGGEITVQSQPGSGTVFHVYLPVAKDRKPLHQKTAPEDSMQGGNECILLVDDEQVLVEMSKRMLENLGYQVVSRVGSVEALEAFRAAPEKYQLVITDQTMPNMTGVQLTREIKKIRPEVPVILCTGFSESVGEDNFRSMGIDAFVMKPIIKRRIAPLIRQVLEKT
jgi:PAS domain S-box-containing protein